MTNCSLRKWYHTWLCPVGLVSYLSCAPPNDQIWHNAVFKLGPVEGPKPTRVRHCQKYLRPHQYFPYKGRLRRQATNPTALKAWGWLFEPGGSFQCWGNTRPSRADQNTFDRNAPETTAVDPVNYLTRAPRNERIWHKTVFMVGPVAVPKPTRVWLCQKYLWPVGILLIMGASGARL